MTYPSEELHYPKRNWLAGEEDIASRSAAAGDRWGGGGGTPV
jgi:hypothetical protein